ncbi:MAG: glucokinase [Pseudomonadota bacterium]
MKAAKEPKRWLIADIGGTNSRLAVWQPTDNPRGELLGLRKLRNAAYVQIDDMLGAYLDGYEGELPSHAVLAIAGPITGDALKLSNIDWSFSVEMLRQKLKLGKLIVVNDFEALAHVVPMLQDNEYQQFGEGTENPGAPSVLIGPGTGLGVASIVYHDSGYVAVPGEGGHVSLSAANEEEARIIEAARGDDGHCSAERLISGNGLSLLHLIMHEETLAADVISQRAHAGDAKAIATLHQCFRFLGSVAGNAALTLGAEGGVYLGGGIIPANVAFFADSGFRERFIDKGRFREYLNPIPTRLITIDTPAIIGLSGLAASR